MPPTPLAAALMGAYSVSTRARGAMHWSHELRFLARCRT
jgi:hypothetical protein